MGMIHAFFLIGNSFSSWLTSFVYLGIANTVNSHTIMQDQLFNIFRIICSKLHADAAAHGPAQKVNFLNAESIKQQLQIFSSVIMALERVHIGCLTVASEIRSDHSERISKLWEKMNPDGRGSHSAVDKDEIAAI